MNRTLKTLGLTVAAATALALSSFAMPAGTSAQADPYVGLDTAQAHSLSLGNAYYTYFLYSPCDYNACTTGG